MIYFLDGNQEVIKIVRSSAVISAIQTQELPEDNSLLRDYLSVRLKNDERLFNAQYMAIKSYGGNRNTFDLYRIASEIVPDNATEFMGVQVAPYELEGVVIEDLRPQNRSLNQTMNQVLEGSDWRLGYVADNLPNVTTNFYYTSVKDALKKIQELTNVEMLFKVEISGNKITDKWVEVYHQLGNRTMKRFNYGTNALSVVRESSHDELYTALIGRGKGEEVGETESGDATYGRKIDFADVEWKKSAGNPVGKPKGQKYIELPNATAEYGIKLLDGRKVPRIGIVEFSDTDDPEILIQETYQELLVRARPKVLFKASVINTGDMLIGDTVTIHRHDLDFHYQARVRKVVRDRKNNNKTQVEIGDVVHTPSTKRQGQINSALNNVASDLENVRGEITEARQSADGKNVNNYGNVEPDRKKVGDTWFRDHPSLTGESQILVWDGEAWELIMDTSETTKNAKAITEQQQEIEETKEIADEAVNQIDTAVANAGFTSLDEAMNDLGTVSSRAEAMAALAKTTGEQAITDASNAQAKANTAQTNALKGISDAKKAQTDATEALSGVTGVDTRLTNELVILEDELSNKISTTEHNALKGTVTTQGTKITQNANAITTKAATSTVNALTGRVSTAETGITTNANAIKLKASQSSVDTLAGTVSTLGAQIDVTAGQISNKVWNTDIQTAVDGIEIGGRNLIRNSQDMSNYFKPSSGTKQETESIDMSDEWGFEQAYKFKLTGGNSRYKTVGRVEPMAHNINYTLSIYVKNIGTSPFAVYIQGAVKQERFHIAVGESKRVEHTFKRREQFNWSQIMLESTSETKNETIEAVVGRIMFEKGNKATDWSPAPEDTTALINHVESELTQKHDSIVATVSSVDGRVATNKLNLDGLTTTVQDVKSDLTGTTTLLNTTRTTVSGHTSSISTLRTDVDGKATTAQFNTLNSTVNGTITRVGNAEGKITQIETNVSGLQTTVADKANQTQVTQLATGLSSVVKDLDDLEIGGRNLLPQSGNFTGAPSSFWGSNGGGLTFDSSITHNGYGTIRTSLGSGIRGEWLKLENGVEYTYSVLMRSETPFEGSGSVPLHYHAGKDNVNQRKITIVEYMTSYTSQDIGKFKKLWITFKLTGDADSFRPFLYGAVDGDVNIAYLKIEKGNKATDWSPAPEDTQSQISQLSDNINLRVTKGELLSQINIEAGRTLIQSDRILLNANNTVITGTAWMDGAVIANASIDGAKIQDATIGSAKIANLDANKITTGKIQGIEVDMQRGYIGDWTIDGARMYRQHGISGHYSIFKGGGDVMLATEVPSATGSTTGASLQIWHDGTLRFGSLGTRIYSTVQDNFRIVSHNRIVLKANATVETDSRIIPTVNNSLNLGIIDQRWANVYSDAFRTYNSVMQTFQGTNSTEIYAKYDLLLRPDDNLIAHSVSVRPRYTNSTHLGMAAYRWDGVYVNSVGVNQSSDERLKNNIRTIKDSLLDYIGELKPIEYEGENNETSFGYSAQDYLGVLSKYAYKELGIRSSEVLSTFNSIDKADSYLGINYKEVEILKGAYRDKRINENTGKIVHIEDEVTQLKNRIKQLEEQLYAS